MDNACHTLCALALLRAGRGPSGPREAAAAVVAANAPDLDAVVLLWGGLPAYLEHHRGITHSVPGIAVLAVLVGVLCWRWPVRAGAGRPGLARLCAAAAMGAVSHLLLDGLNSYGIRPWLPFSGRWLYFDVAFIVDPLLWLLFGAAAAFGAPATRAANIAFWAWTLAATSVLLVAAGKGAPGCPAAVLFGCGMAAVLLWHRRGPARAGHCRIALMLSCAYVALLSGLGLRAEQRARAALARAGHGVEEVVATCRMARPGHPFAFEVMAATEAAVHPVAVDLWRGEIAVGAALPRHLDEPLLQRVRLGRELRAWRAFARLPVVERDGSRLRLGDARFMAFGRTDWSAIEVEAGR